MRIDDFGAALETHGIRSGSGVPCSYFTPLVNYMAAKEGLDYIPATSEGEAVAIACGLTAGGKPAFALMQNSGLGNAVNPITSLVEIYQIPIALLVSHRGEPGTKDEPQHRLMGEITEQLSALCGLETHVMSPDSFSTEIGSAQARRVAAAWVVRNGTIEGGPKAPPVQLRVETGFAPVVPKARLEPSLSREDALRATLPFLNRTGADRPAVVTTTGKLSRELFEIDDQEHDKSNRFYMVGSMGCAAGFGLGLARAQRRKVIVLDGDGALLMKLGTLATVGMVRPSNFHHVVIDNGAYDTTGGQLTASPHVDFAQVALSCGYVRADTVASAADYERTLAEHMASDGPTLLRMLVRPGARKDLGRPSITPEQQWTRFTAFLKESV